MADQLDTSIDTADVLAVDAELARTTGGGVYGITNEGFVPKPFARLLAEKLALARTLLGDELDLRSGSVVRTLMEVSALEDARTWSALATMYDDAFVVSATGAALTRLGEELGLPRPFLPATGRVRLILDGDLPAGESVTIPRGTRLLTPGGHHAATDETITLSNTARQRDVAVVAFHPGPEHDIDPAVPSQTLDRLHPLDAKLGDLYALQRATDPPFEVKVGHTEALTGGDLRWPDVRYRELLLRAPRSAWTAEALEIAVSLVPGVRQVTVRDQWGGLDIRQSIFGNFSFVERLFVGERDIASPYYVTILVAASPAAIWEGPDGLRVAIESAVDDLRPLSIFPEVVPAAQVGIGVSADLVVRGLPLPSGSRESVNDSDSALALKARLLARLRRYVDGLGFGEPVRASEMVWALMSEPGIADARDVRLLRYPAAFDDLDFGTPVAEQAITVLDCGQNAEFDVNQVAVLVDDPARLRIV
ncbi:hypothetical protein [Nonomuraea sp. NPDC003201]